MTKWMKAALIATPLVVLLALGAFALEASSDAGKTCSSTRTAGATASCPAKAAATTDAASASTSGCPMHATQAQAASAADPMLGCSMHGGAKAADAGAAAGTMPGCSMHAGAKAVDAAAAQGCGMQGGSGCCCCGGSGAAGARGATAGGMAGAGCGPMGRAAGARGAAMSCGAGAAMGVALDCGPGAGMSCGAGAAMGCGPGPAGAMAAMMRGLDLSPEQRRKVADAHESAQRSAIQAQADLRLAALDLRKLVAAERPDRGRIDAQIDKMARLRAALQKTHVAALLEVRSILTPEQVKKLQAADLPLDE